MMLLPMQSLYVQNFKIRDGFSSKIPVLLKVIFEVQKLASVVLEISLNDMTCLELLIRAQNFQSRPNSSGTYLYIP